MRKLVKIIMAMGMFIAASPSLKAQDFVMSGIEVSDAIAQCEAGDAQLCHEVAVHYLLQTDQNPSLNSTAIDYFAKACGLGRSDGCYSSGSDLTVNPELAAFRGYQTDFDRGVKLFEKGCANVDTFASANCKKLTIFYFEGSYDSITLEQAYNYAITECDDQDYESCFALYHAYDRIANMPDVPSKETLLVRAVLAKLIFEF